MQRNHVFKVLIAVLVVFNLIRWWPHDTNVNKVEDWRDIEVSQLKINGVTHDFRYKNTRNLFYNENIAEIKKEIKLEPVTNNSNSSLPDIRLIGVVFKNKRYEAFLIKGEDRFNVKLNNYIAQRYKVKHINIKSIELKDMQTGQTHEIQLSDE